MGITSRSLRIEIGLAKAIWGKIGVVKETELLQLMERYQVLVSLGDVISLDGRWYVTHSGLLRIALRKHCLGIKATLEKRLSDPMTHRWVFKAVVYKSRSSRGFVGYGDADPSNTSSLVRGAEMRVAETRAVNRALRKA